MSKYHGGVSLCLRELVSSQLGFTTDRPQMHKRHALYSDFTVFLHYTSPNPTAYSTRYWSTLYTRCLIAIQGIKTFCGMVLFEALEFDLLPKELVKVCKWNSLPRILKFAGWSKDKAIFLVDGDHTAVLFRHPFLIDRHPLPKSGLAPPSIG